MKILAFLEGLFRKRKYNMIITKEDYENSSKEFNDINNCPQAAAFRRTFPNRKCTIVNPTNIFGEVGVIAHIFPEFGIGSYEKLAKQGEEFKTMVTFI